MLLTGGRKEDGELEHVGRRYIDTRLWMHVPGFFDVHESVQREVQKIVLGFEAVERQRVVVESS